MTYTSTTLVTALEEAVNAFWRQTRWFHEPLTVGRARMFVLQHRLNTRYRNSVLKLRVASQIPHWDLRMGLLRAVSQEVVADQEYGRGKPHWQILKELGLAIGLTEAEIENARPLPSTRLAWLAWEGLMSNHHWLEGIVASTVAERINVPGCGEGEIRERGWFAVERWHWKYLFGLSDEQLWFFDMHGDADKEHSALGFEAVARYATELGMEEAVLAAAQDTLGIWTLYLNGISAGGDALDRELAGYAS